jgi:hypothetical protein
MSRRMNWNAAHLHGRATAETTRVVREWSPWIEVPPPCAGPDAVAFERHTVAIIVDLRGTVRRIGNVLWIIALPIESVTA